MNVRKPVAYIASPYSKGDPAINTHFQCKIFDQLLTENLVIPVAPLWTHFQHLLYPRPYEDWIKYDQETLFMYDCCLRLDAIYERTGYSENRSNGADAEVKAFQECGKPVFFTIEEMNCWVRKIWNNHEKQEA